MQDAKKYYEEFYKKMVSDWSPARAVDPEMPKKCKESYCELLEGHSSACEFKIRVKAKGSICMDMQCAFSWNHTGVHSYELDEPEISNRHAFSMMGRKP